MPPETEGVLALFGGPSPKTAQDRTPPRACPVVLVPRRLHPRVAEMFDALPPDALPRLRGEGTASDLGRALEASMAERGTRPAWLATWLLDDVVDHAETIAALTGARRLRFRLDAIADDGCTKFHVDAVRLRLVTTYRGPGTEWFSPRDVGQTEVEPPADVVRRLARGEVAVLRGNLGATPDEPGVLHRSPPIAGTGITRLFLAIDALDETGDESAVIQLGRVASGGIQLTSADA